MFLEKIKSPEDLKNIPAADLDTLAKEVRQKLLETVSQTGGHLAANLCVVELTIALHRTFNSPRDKIVFDVGHQAYVHKLFTGRYEQFDTLRQWGGISGFPKRSESEHDAFGVGHSSTSISAAAGIAAANSIKGETNYTVVVVGDGAFTGGMIYEALNNCSDKERLIIVLNDNDMSISPNVGGLSKSFSKFRSSVKYFRFKSGIKRFFKAIPLIGTGLTRLARWIKNRFKKMLMRPNFFEQFGLNYYGPLNGNNERLLEMALREAKDDKYCSVVHICTTKGKGYEPAEKRPDLFHGVSGFDIKTGELKNGGEESFSERFGKIICDRAEKDSRITAITAAMPDGTGLADFASRYPNRFFDVGIAEEHALTFACGLATEGIVPVFAVYSTFMQRAFDQLIHDAALQNLHIIVMLDRAGLVANDGATHHGIFDAAYVTEIPNVLFFAPNSFKELEECFDKALNADCPVVIRYPKSGDIKTDCLTLGDGFDYADFGESPKNAIVTYSRLTDTVVNSAKECFEKGVAARAISLTQLSPLPQGIFELLAGMDKIVFAEEGIKNGGIAQQLCAALAERDMLKNTEFVIKAIDNCFPQHGSNNLILKDLGLSQADIARAVLGEQL